MQTAGPQAIMDYGTRRMRRTTIKSVLSCLTAIRDAEQRYLDNVPENFQNSESFDVGECAVDAIDEAISILDGIY